MDMEDKCRKLTLIIKEKKKADTEDGGGNKQQQAERIESLKNLVEHMEEQKKNEERDLK